MSRKLPDDAILARKVEQQPQLIDLSEKPARAKVVREGFSVPTVTIDKSKTDFVIDSLPTILPRDLPRVVSQSITPGTKVAQGTVVDLIMAPKSVIPFEIVENVHSDLKGKTLNQVDDIVEDPKVREVLLKFEDAGDVPAADKQLLVNAFRTSNITVDDTNPEKSFDRAFSSVRAAVAFR